MTDLIKILYLLSLLGFLYYLTIRVFITRVPFGKKEWVITLLLIGTSLILYIRLIVYDFLIIEPSDEALYVSLIKEVSNGMEPPISGPGFVYLILLINSISGWPIEEITATFGLFIGSVFLLVLYFVYKESMGSREEAVYSCVLILCTSYLLWPMIEARPQQLGMLLVLIGGYFYHTYLSKGKYLVPLIILCLFTFIFHILSFLILMGLVILLWWFHYLDDRANLKEVIWPAFVLISGVVIFIGPFSIYSSMNKGVIWMLRKSDLNFMQNSHFLVIILIISILIAVPLTRYLKKKKIIVKLRDLGKKHVGKIMLFIIVALIIVLTVQFILNNDIHSKKYRGSLLFFILFQLGNIFFGALFLKAYFKSIKDGRFDDPFFRFASIIMLMGMVSLFLSLFLPLNFNNWMIRMINYWTVFAAPMASKVIMEMQPKRRFFLALILPILIIISLLNISRDQTLFGYP